MTKQQTADLLVSAYVTLWHTMNTGKMPKKLAYDLSRVHDDISAAYRSLTGETIGKAAGLSD